MCPFSGAVLVGHAGGDVRLYQFSDAAAAVHRHGLDEGGAPYKHVGVQVRGPGLGRAGDGAFRCRISVIGLL